MSPRARTLCLVGALLACRRERAAPAPASGPGEREALVGKIAALDELAPCLVDAGPAPLRIVDAEVAGEAAQITFVCANGARRGKVTFFRIAGAWMISTKELGPPSSAGRLAP